MSTQSNERFLVVRRHDGAQERSRDTEAFIIEESLGYLVNYSARAFYRELAQRLSPHGVWVGQWAVLMFLWAEDGLSQRELSRRVAIEDATMVRSIDRMERDGLVRRERDTSDRRQIMVFLTEKGRAMRDILVPEAIAGNQKAARLLSEEETRQFRDLLRKVIVALKEPAPSSPEGREP
jgi:DNA-binding MarR family transcriptional regulator